MSIHSTLNDEHLIRTQLWSKQIKELLLDDLYAMRFVRTITDFPDGTTLNIPSIGEAETSDFAEGMAIKYNKLDTGNFQFEFDQYKYSANAITNKMIRDSFYSSELLAAFAPRQHRALMEAVETRIFDRANSGQTPNDLNTINTAPHRFIASGSNGQLTFKDFSDARYALKKANVPMNNLTAIVDPSVARSLEQQANVMNLMTPMPKWGDMTHGGLTSGFSYRFTIYGFDVYESNYLPVNLTDSIDGKSASDGVANLFFSATPGDTLPIIGAFRQMPTVESEYNKDLQQHEYLTICEYGFKLYRPENMVVVISERDAV